jgi:protein-L-isoaspartate(D-aspartate) O-methyltransferase
MEIDINKILSDKYEKYFDYLNQNMIVNQIMGRGIKNTELIAAIKLVKRHYFLPDSLKTRAYDDCAIEILPEQTISQPYVVALMIALVDIKKEDRVLEIGTGTGWQTTILSKLSKEVYSIDIRDSLFEFASKRIERYGNNNVYLKIGDGKEGWVEKSPFDKIIVSCATNEIPQKLLEQIKNGGKMVLPVEKEGSQRLNLIQKDKEGMIKTEESIDVVFVRMK